MNRPKTIPGVTYKTASPMGDVFVTINTTPEEGPYEVFIRIGKSGSDINGVVEGYGRIVSLYLKAGGKLEYIVEQLEGIGGRNKLIDGDRTISSLPDAIAKIFQDYLKEHKPEEPVFAIQV